MKNSLRSGFQLIALIFLAAGAWAATEGSPRLVFFGDSLTSGYGLDATEDAYPAQLQVLLEAEGVGASVVNAGLSGETTAGGLRRLDWILKQPADYLFIGLGGNDLLRGLPVEASEANLRGMIEKARARHPDIQIVLMGMEVPPSMGSEYAAAFSAIYPRLAREMDTQLYPFLLGGVGGVPELNQPDGIHPNAKGHLAIAEGLLPFVQRLLSEE